MKRTTYLIPLLWAIQWGACFDPSLEVKTTLSQHERDARFAVAAFCTSMAILLGSRQARAFDE